jgi:hypothetical protein
MSNKPPADPVELARFVPTGVFEVIVDAHDPR